MKPSSCLRLLLGLMFIALVACSDPQSEEEPDLSVLPTTFVTPIQAEDATATSATNPTNAPPPLPTALPTSANDWQQVGGLTAGLQISAPAAWVDFTSAIDTAVATNEIGLIVLFGADSQTTGESLLARKGLDSGAYFAGLVGHLELTPNTPQSALNRLVSELNLTVLSDSPQLVTAVNGSGASTPGAYIDVAGSPLSLGATEAQPLRTRIYLFTTSLTGASNQQNQAIFLFTATETDWNRYVSQFTQMAETIHIHNIRSDFVLSNGSANVVGSLGETDMVSGELQARIKDVWTFTVREPRYATITLQPDSSELDLTMTLYSPAGETITRVDNGFAGRTEVVTDLLLADSGLYVIEISDFFNMNGRYTLTLVLAETPIYGGGGPIEIGQTVESSLPANGQHGWMFQGSAGDIITVVLTPEGTFDPVLELLGPDGDQLLTLDEGFSGDAEVFSGFELPVSGEYSIVVHSFSGSGGDYTLSLDQGGEQIANFYDAGDIALGETKRETLRADEAHAWFLNGQAGQDIVVKVLPVNERLDLDVWLLDNDINRLAAVDDALRGQAETLTYTLPASGQYILLIRDFFGEAGAYDIQLTTRNTAVPVFAGQLENNTSVVRQLPAGQQAAWSFDAAANEMVTVAVEPVSGIADWQLQLINPAGEIAVAVDASGAGQAELLSGFSLRQAGSWQLVVSSFFGDTGEYQLSFVKSP